MEKKRIVCFGDSLTWGFDPDTRTRFPEESRWPMVLQKLLGEEYRVIEEGQNGRTIVVSKDLPAWYRQLADMYHCEYMDAAEHAVVSDKDGCHMDAENQRKLGKAVYERIKGLI